jgi:Ger(x)C family germination protein
MKINVQNISLIFFIIIALLCSSGCNKQELNDAAISLGLGIDWQTGIYTVSVELAKPMPPEKSSPEDKPFIILSGTGNTITEAARNITLSLSQYPIWSHSEVILLGENLAQKDVALFADFFTRNRFVRKNIPLLITRGASPEDILDVKTPLEPHSAHAIAGLLKVQEKQLGLYVPVNFSDFLEKMATPGIEAVLPQITIAKQGEKSLLTLDGTAVFKDRKMVGSLDEMESRGYRWMQARMIEGGIIIIPSPLDQTKLVTLELTRSKATIKPEIKDNTVKMKIAIKAEGNFYEQNSAGNILTLENIPKIEALANEEISRQISLCINKAQYLKSDILGWGRMINSKNPKLWKDIEKDWPQIFAGMEYDITVKYELRRTYLTDRSFVFQE